MDQVVKQEVLTPGQIRRIRTGHRVTWGEQDVSRAVGLRCRSRQAYEYVREVFNLPLPSQTTLARWTQGFLVAPGVIDAAYRVLQAAVQGMTELERLCVISFDEMSLDERYSYDATLDQVVQGKKLQLMMVRGLCGPWKQPIFYQLDQDMTISDLNQVVTVLEALQLCVVAVVSDMGSQNEAMWRSAGISSSRSWISHPVDPAR